MKFSSLGAICAVTSLCAASIAMAQPAQSIAPAMLHIPEGTQFSIKFDDQVSSASATVGDEFTIESVDPVTLPNGQVLPAGLMGVGEVTAAHKRGMMGKGGELSIRLDYLRAGSQHVRLRGAKGGSGKDSTGTTVALVVLFGPLGLLKHGHEMTIEKGQKVVAYADQDIDVTLPTVAPPSGSAAAVSQ
ncbi:MAG: hypothetical protein WA840_06960 [Caulobacteraceae bacterium]